MGQCGAGLACFGLLVLVLGQDSVASKNSYRIRRQIDSWGRRYEEIGRSSDLRRFLGVASLPVNLMDHGRHLRPAPSLHYNNQWEGRGYVGYTTGGLQPWQLQSEHNSPISVQCGEDRMVVTVKKDLYGSGRLVKASDLILGPQSCRAGIQTTDTTVVFEVGLQDCGNSLQMTPDWLIYGTNLTFNPTSGVQNLPITRSTPAVVPIQCYYPRYGNVSSKAVKPTWVPFATTVSSEEQLAFSLRLMTEDWTAPRSSLVFNLGDIFYIEAALETKNHVPVTLFIDSCVATTSPDVTSSPGYELLAYNGCLMDGTQEDSSSAFRSPRSQPNKLQFMVDVFRFIDSQASTIYITCSLRAAADTQAPDPMNKACSYSKTSNSWSAVEGPSDICSCCNTQNCVAPSGQSRRWDPSYERPRRLDKREVVQGWWSENRRALASVGPLLVLEEHQRRSLALREASTMKMWILLGVGGLGFVVVFVCAFIIARSLKKKVPPLDVLK